MSKKAPEMHCEKRGREMLQSERNFLKTSSRTVSKCLSTHEQLFNVVFFIMQKHPNVETGGAASHFALVRDKQHHYDDVIVIVAVIDIMCCAYNC